MTTPLQEAINARLDRPPKISKRGLAREIGVKPDTLIAWQRGRRPHGYQLGAAASALGVTVPFLKGDASPAPPRPASAEVPTDVADALRQAAGLVDINSSLEQLAANVPDLVKLLRDAEECVRRLGL